MTSLYRYATLDEAIERANAVPFGLSASIFTRDLHAVQRFSEELQAGILHVNSQTAGADVHVPFGGIKGSGFGPHEQGRAALEFFTEAVTVYQDAPLAVAPRALPRHRRPRLPRRLGGAGCARRRRRRRRLRPRRRPVAPRPRPRRRRRARHARPRRHHRPRRCSSATLDEHEITRVVHLAALQVPFVRANPPLGMRVNVAGTVNVFEAVAKRLDRIPGVAYASSAAVYTPLGPLPRARVRRHRARHPLRRLEARRRGHGARLRRRRRLAVDRPAPVRRLRPGPRPGHDVRPDRGDARGRARRAVRDRLHRARRSTTTRPTSARAFVTAAARRARGSGRLQRARRGRDGRGRRRRDPRRRARTPRSPRAATRSRSRPSSRRSASTATSGRSRGRPSTTASRRRSRTSGPRSTGQPRRRSRRRTASVDARERHPDRRHRRPAGRPRGGRARRAARLAAPRGAGAARADRARLPLVVGPGRGRALPLARPASRGSSTARNPVRQLEDLAPHAAEAAAGDADDARADRAAGAGARGGSRASRAAGRRARRPGRLRLRRVRDPPVAARSTRAGSARSRATSSSRRATSRSRWSASGCSTARGTSSSASTAPGSSTSTGRRSSPSTCRPSRCWRRRRRRSGSRSRSSAARSRSTSGGSRSGACRSTCSTRSSTRTTPSTGGSRPASTRGTRSRGSASTACSAIGTVRALRALGIEPGVLHFNEGHPALAALELAARRRRRRRDALDDALAARARALRVHDAHAGAGGQRGVRDRIVRRGVRRPPGRLGIDNERFLDLCRTHPDGDEWPGMTPLALRLARRANAVSLRHGEVAREMWRPLFGDGVRRRRADHARHERRPPPDVPLAADARACSTATSATGGSTAPSDPATWAPVDEIPDEELWAARNEARAPARRLRQGEVACRTACCAARIPRPCRSVAETFAEDTLTLGFARRIATYKRLFLLTYDPERVRRIFADGPPLQMVVAGKAHPLDDNAKQMLVDVFGALAGGRDHVPRRVPRELRPLGRRADRRRLRRLGQRAAPAARGERDERDEVGGERRAQPERARRLVGRGLRRRERLGDRRRAQDGRGRGGAGRPPRARALRPARAAGDPALPRPRRRRDPAPLARDGASGRSGRTARASPPPAWSRSTRDRIYPPRA